MKNIEDQKSFSDEMSQVEGVRTVNYSEGTVSAMTSFGRLVGYASVAIIVVLLAVGIFLISNTVMIGISVRKKEINWCFKYFCKSAIYHRRYSYRFSRSNNSISTY